MTTTGAGDADGRGTAAALFRRLSDRDPRALGRAISAVENGDPLGAAVVELARAAGLSACIVGLTGPPGAGKSSLASRLVAAYRAADRRVAVLAVDPSSPFTGGAILGDRVRMQEHASDPDVFVRSMAARGVPGGVAGAAADAVALLGAAGFDVVLVETVGVGQGEVEIARIADVTLVLAVPGAGDDIQALKSGLMEIADVFVVNKADRDGADAVAGAIEASLTLVDGTPGAWRPPVLQVSALTGAGVADLVATIERCRTDEARAAARRARHLQAVGSTGERRSGVIDHVGIAVSDGEAARALFASLFNLSSDAGESVVDQNVRVWFLGTDDTRLELVAPTSETSPVAAFLAKRGPGLHHVALRVPDLSQALARLRSQGVRLIDSEPRVGAHGRRVAFVHPSSTSGVLVELVEADGQA